ncbi:MAG TPA: hypothetical protein H9824_05355 [Candidatus Bacteroides pullicola]|uniref:Lipoprotein n=1 Tax=Candidatus Bacteroides pullicola TaxID=2838475 RepID=A0A9D1ZID6_9BACE|nr:hypothetical protein [Candidatus Bacteroides pullicola]
MKLKPYLQSLGCAVMLLLAASCTDDALDNGANNGQNPEADSNVVTLTVLDGASQQGRIHTPAAPDTRALKSQRLQYVATIKSTEWQDKDHVWSATSVYIDDDTKQAYVTWHSDRQATNHAQMWGGALDIISIANEDKPQMTQTLASEEELKFNNVMKYSEKLYLSAMHHSKGGVVARVDLNTPTKAELIGFPGSSVNAIALSDEKLMVVSGFKGTYGTVSPSQEPIEYDYDNPKSDKNQYVTLNQEMDKDFGGKYVAVDEGGRAYILRQNGDKGQIIDVKGGTPINMSVPLLSENKYAEDFDPTTGDWTVEGTRRSEYFGKHVMVIREGYAYVAAGKSGIFKYNLMDGKETKINGIFATGLYADEEFLYAATGSGLRIYKFNDETGDLPLYAFEVETYDEEKTGAPTSTTAATTGADKPKRHSPNFVTAHRTDKGIYIYIAYGQSGVRVYKFVKEGEEQPEEPDDHPWVDPGDDSDIVWATEDVEGYYAWGEIFHTAHGMGDGNPYEQAPADAEGLSFTRIIDGQEVTVTNNAEYWGEGRGYTTKTIYSFDNYRYFDGTRTEGVFQDRREEREGYFTKLTKYTLDGKTKLDPEDDVAFMRWGDGWRMPTISEWYQMVAEFGGGKWEVNVTDPETGRTGILITFTANNNTLFLPFAGAYGISDREDDTPGLWTEGWDGPECYYWTSDLSNQSASAYDKLGNTGGWIHTGNPMAKFAWSVESKAWMPDFALGTVWNGYNRCIGMKVRPVKDKKNMPEDFPEWQNK